MGFLDQAINTASEALDNGLADLAGAFGISLNGAGLSKDGPIYTEANSLLNSGSGQVWKFKGGDWYQIFGYQFVVRVLDDNGAPTTKEFIYTLPIPPQNFNVRMIPATQATPTIGGVVEETNENVFWLITMAGTTGIAVSRPQSPALTDRSKMANKFREKVSTTGLLSGALAGINTAISKFGGTADALYSAATSGDITGTTGGLVGAFNTLFLPNLPYSASAVDQDTNGYTEMQEFHRFLYVYSKLKGKFPAKYDLVFRSYKLNQEWNCVVQDFTVQQSAQNPMLYRYNIALKGWSVREASNSGSKEVFDRFGPNGDLKAVNLVTPEVFNTVKNEYFTNKNFGIG